MAGCTSNTLGLSNLLSDVVESLCCSIAKPYEVISSEDMLSRIEKFNELVGEKRKQKEIEGITWDWRNDWMMVGSDVVSLFPSLTAENTARIVRSQAEKIPIHWENIDTKWLRMYIHQNRSYSHDTTEIDYLLPRKRKGKRGPEPGMSSKECMRRHLEPYYEDGDISSWVWPPGEPSEKEVHKLML